MNRIASIIAAVMLAGAFAACDSKTLDKTRDVGAGVIKLATDLLTVAPAIIGDVSDIKDSLKPRSKI